MKVISKADLQDGAYYRGTCRNATIARWDGRNHLFIYWRTKFAFRFLEAIQHPEDEARYDTFEPYAQVEAPEEPINLPPRP